MLAASIVKRKYPKQFDGHPDFDDYPYFNPDTTVSTDWQDEIYRSAISQNHDISFSSGTSKTSYRASLNFFDQEGIMETSYLKRYTARTNIRHTGINDKLSIDFNFTRIGMN